MNTLNALWIECSPANVEWLVATVNADLARLAIAAPGPSADTKAACRMTKEADAMGDPPGMRRCESRKSFQVARWAVEGQQKATAKAEFHVRRKRCATPDDASHEHELQRARALHFHATGSILSNDDPSLPMNCSHTDDL